MPLHRLLPALALCLALAACDAGGEVARVARGHVARGDLDAALVALEGARGREVDQLRSEIERASQHRVQVRERIDLMLGRLGPSTSGSTRTELRKMVNAERDPGTRELLERTLSDLSDLLAEKARTNDREQRGVERIATLAPEPAPEAAAAPAGSDRERLAERLRSDAEEAHRAGQWARGLGLLDLLAGQEGVTEDEVNALRLQLIADARTEISRLRSEALELELREGPRAGLERLEEEAARFPEEGELAYYHSEIADLRQLAEEAEASTAELEEQAFIALSEIDVEGVELQPGAEAEELVRLARARLEGGDLAGARTLLLAAAQREWPGARRDDWVGQARDLKGRLALRGELADARRADPEAFREMGLFDADAQGWTTAAGPVPWAGVPVERLVLAARMADLSPLARRGLSCERLLSGESRLVEAALDDLARAVLDGELDQSDAANLVSRLRAEGGARRAYLLEGGEWKPASAVAARERTEKENRLEGALVFAGVDGRDAALEEMVVEVGAETAARAVHVRMSSALKVVRSGRTVGQLEKLAARREELDRLRARALRLIFDEETYFYPYDPPEPPRTAGDYARAQREVDRAVGAVREAWGGARPVRLPDDFRAAAEELGWGAAQLADLGFDGELPHDVPPWLTGLPSGLEEVGLAELAWDAEEARELAEGRLVRARNERQWEGADAGFAGLGRDAIPAQAEREQVRVTNDYRAMMGRRVLAWNARIQAAAQGHSNYMADTGDFGHFEKDPERRAVVDRLKLVDYPRGGSENVARNGGGAQGAHDGWLQSSGHHRNILEAGHLEMASALSGFYWTQNFGRDDSFREDLER